MMVYFMNSKTRIYANVTLFDSPGDARDLLPQSALVGKLALGDLMFEPLDRGLPSLLHSSVHLSINASIRS